MKLFNVEKDVVNQCWAPIYGEYKKTFETFDQAELKKHLLNREAFSKLNQLFTSFYAQSIYFNLDSNSKSDTR